jgi:hypothetical protein
MSNTIYRARLTGTWCMSVMAIGAAAIVLGGAITIADGLLLAAVCLVPPTIMLFVWSRTEAAPMIVAS